MVFAVQHSGIISVSFPETAPPPTYKGLKDENFNVLEGAIILNFTRAMLRRYDWELDVWERSRGRQFSRSLPLSKYCGRYAHYDLGCPHCPNSSKCCRTFFVVAAFLNPLIKEAEIRLKLAQETISAHLKSYRSFMGTVLISTQR